MQLNPKCTAKQYTIPLTYEQFTHLDSFDMNEDIEDGLSKILERHCNAFAVDFNGHFGANIFLTLETADDTPENWNAIEAFILDHVRRSHQWAQAEKILELLSHHHKHHTKFYILLDNKYQNNYYKRLTPSAIKTFIIAHANDFDIELNNVSWEHVVEGINSVMAV